MADNVTADPGVGGATFASDDIAGVQYPRTKFTLGADGVNGGDVSSSNPMPVQTADGAIATLGTTTDVSAPADNSDVSLVALFKRLLARLTTLITNVATGAKQDTSNVSLAAIDAKLGAALNVTGSIVSITGNVEVTNDAGNPLPVSGTVALSTAVNLEATQLLVKAKTDNLDVALSTRLKPADTLAAVTNLAQLGGQAVTMGTGVRAAGTLRVTIATDDSVPVTNANLDVALSTRLKPADTLTGVTTVATVTNLAQLGGQAVAMGTGVRSAGTLRVTVATDDLVPVGGDAAHDAADSGNPVKIGGTGITGFAAAVSATLDRVRAWFDVYGRQIVAKRDSWWVTQAPAVATQATIAKASAGAGVKNVCTSLAITLSSTAAPTVGSVLFNLRDGATGAGTILWSARLSIPAVAGNGANLALSDLWIEGTAATVMTLESSAAPAANTFATVAMTGTITQ